MVVVTLESLPLGFRFHPTDEELINHYLKGKIKGRKSQFEVIPEIDVCKCEPWDLPDKSVIKTLDPEWFFFSPRDRKYPNGHRSNRATGAGYWKATGKDRNIKSRASSGATLIGMKKTLVFYFGRVPNGERTGWIIHEYRIIDGEVDGKSGDQGDYVLCRLFKKPLGKSMNSNYDELDEDGFSFTPVKSSPGETQHEVEFDISSDQYVMSKDLQYKHPLTDAVEQQQDQFDTRNLPLTPEDSNSNSNSNMMLRADLEVQSEIEDAIALNDLICIDDLANSLPLSPFATSGLGQMDSSGVESFDKKTNNDLVMESAKNDLTEDDTMTAFLDSLFLNPDQEFKGKSMNSNYDELDEDGFSFTPVKSSPGDTQHEVEFDISSDQYVMSKDLQYKRPLTDAVEQQQDQFDTRNLPPTPEDSNSNTMLRADLEVQSEIEDAIALNDLICIDDLANSLPMSPFATSGLGQMDSSGVESFDKKTNNDLVMESAKNDLTEDDTMTAFLDSLFLNPDQEFKGNQYSFADTESNQIHQMYGLHDALSPELSCDETTARAQLQTQNVESDFNSQLYSSMDSWESLFKYSQTVQDGTVTNSSDCGMMVDIDDGSVNTGIQIRPRAVKQSISTTFNQGNATRRIRLQCKLQVECSLQKDTQFDELVCDLKVEEDSQQKTFQEEDVYQQVDAKMLENSHADEICLTEKASDVDIRTVSSSKSKLASKTFEPADKICMVEKSLSDMDNMNQSKSVLRQRKVLGDDAGAIQNRSLTENPQGTKCSAFRYLVFGGVLLIPLVMFVGMWKYL